MTQYYEKPVISKLENSLMNKYGQSGPAAGRVRTAIDGATIDNLVMTFGSPLFVYSEKTLRRRCRQLHNAFATRYPNVLSAWSYKTNYLKAICAILHQEGSTAVLSLIAPISTGERQSSRCMPKANRWKSRLTLRR